MASNLIFIDLARQLKFHIRTAESLLAAGMADAAYHYLFNVAQEDVERAASLFGEIKYYAPDTTYEEDADAKIGQLEDYVDTLRAAAGKEANRDDGYD